MTIITFHSYRGGTGKSTLVANFATAVAMRGRRVGLLEFDTLSPGLRILFDVNIPPGRRYLNDLLCGEGEIDEAVLDLTQTLHNRLFDGPGRLFFLPASQKGEDIFKLLRDGYSAHLCMDIIREFQERYDLDFLFIDTHPGFEEDTLIALTASEMIIIVLRMDEQDYYGAKIAVDVNKTIGKKLYLLFNMVPNEIAESHELSYVISRVKKFLGAPVIGIIPFYKDLLAATGRRLFVVDSKGHPFSITVNTLVSKLLDEFDSWLQV